MSARPIRTIALALIAAATWSLSGCSASGDEQVLEFEHGPVTATLVDLGDSGPSVGDQRFFHLEGTMDGAPAQLNGMMVTTASSGGTETRVATLVVSLTGSPEDQITFEGTAEYAVDSPALKVETVTRAVTGGSGKYAGAAGYVDSTHREDDSWVHAFHVILQ